MIDINNIAFGYKTRSPLFEEITVSIGAGDILGVTGDNGSGKTTLLKVIAGYLRHTEGTINYHKSDPKIAFIPANLDYFLLPWYRVHQNISFFQSGGVSLGTIESFNLKEISSYLPHVRNHFGENFVYSLSSGEKAVVAFACALHARPDLIILDEIFSNTTRAVSLKMIEIIKAKVKVPIIFTSHTTEFMEMLSTKTVKIPKC